MKPTILEIHCLNALCDDYENIASVKASLIRALRQFVDENDVWNCLLKLTFNGWSDAYLIDANGKFNVVTIENKPKDKTWFSITAKGRQILDENWIDDEK